MKRSAIATRNVKVAPFLPTRLERFRRRAAQGMRKGEAVSRAVDQARLGFSGAGATADEDIEALLF